VNVLLVSTQFPYPPRSGFTTRVYQLARQLQNQHSVTLLSYAAPDQFDGVWSLGPELPARIVERREPTVRAKRAAQGLSLALPGPYSCRDVFSDGMQEAIDELSAREHFDYVQLESSLLCTFRFPPGPRIVLDEHNVEYEVFQRMSRGERSVPRRAFNRVEHYRFRRFERDWWTRVDSCVVTSERELRIVRQHAPRTPVTVVPNGVDLEYFRPEPEHVEPNTVVFNGILTYRPNLDAAQHLIQDVWPRVLRRRPEAHLEIVGRVTPSDEARLKCPGVVVTGEVPDVRPYLSRAAVVVIPVRIGGGTRLKVLESLAMGKPTVSTSLGCEGLAVRDGEHLLLGDGSDAFARQVVRLLEEPDEGAELGRVGRQLVERAYSWDLAGRRLTQAYRAAAAPPTGLVR
jgi:polysaccharide biosynthesis protein PslH